MYGSMTYDTRLRISLSPAAFRSTTVSARLGHSKPTTTLAIYSSAMEGGQDMASRAIGEPLEVASEDGR